MAGARGAHGQAEAPRFADWYPHHFEKAEAHPFGGAFRAESMAWFVVHHGGDLRLTVTARRPEEDRLEVDGTRLRRAVFVQSLLPLEEEWRRETRALGLFGMSGGFNHIPRILGDQDLDPSSPEYGLGTNTAWLGPAYEINQPFTTRGIHIC